jgi:hypothetical protein
VLLKDNGTDVKERRDNVKDVVRMKGNDFLTLDAVTAQKIGLSKGTADTVEDLLFDMGIPRNYAIVKNKSDKIFADWRKKVADAEKQILRLYDQYNSVQVKQPGGFKERTAARSQRKTILRQILSVVQSYEESMDPKLLDGSANELSNTVRVLLDRIDQAQRLDRPEAP